MVSGDFGEKVGVELHVCDFESSPAEPSNDPHDDNTDQLPWHYGDKARLSFCRYAFLDTLPWLILMMEGIASRAASVCGCPKG